MSKASGDNLTQTEDDALKPVLVCPNCWKRFRVEDVLWIARHSELRGDPLLGPEAMARFRPSRFNVAGDALDARDQACQDLACPRCHLSIPRVLLEHDPLFFSLVGAPGSGKTTLLTSMTWELRKRLPRDFFLAFSDADPLSNRLLNEYEEMLFLDRESSSPISLPETTAGGEHYHRVERGDEVLHLPRPFFFSMRPMERHPNAKRAHDLARLLAIYDHAGEHFLPSTSPERRASTEHLGQSRILLFLLDPTQDAGLRKHCEKVSQDAQLSAVVRTERQEQILLEMVQRVREFGGLPANKKIDRPLLVLVGKSDIWSQLVDEDMNVEPFTAARSDAPAELEFARAERVSSRVRDLLVAACPRFVQATEDHFAIVRFMPISALGRSPEYVNQKLVYRPKHVRPKWTAVPLAYAFAIWATSLINVHRAAGDPGASNAGQPVE